MEEDIEILKDLKYKWVLNAFGDRVNVFCSYEIKAIENILNRLEQLEKENKELKLKNERLAEKYAKSLMGVSLKELLKKWDKE